MIFFLFLYFFSYIRGDCLEFNNNNQCLILQSEIHDLDIDHYYPECLQCKIQTFIEPENIKFEDENQCLLIELQCIQLIFDDQEIFEDFFQFHQHFLYDLFYKDNGTDQNTLHIIVKENTLEEINTDYIERIFQVDYQAYRALFFEVHIQNEDIQINRDLINITRLSMKLILVCQDQIQSIYIIHNRKITLESKQDLCPAIFIPSSTKSIITSSSKEILSISHGKSKDIILIIILLTGFLLGLSILLMIYCFKRIRRHYKRLSKTIDTTSELSISQDETPNEKPILNIKPKRPVRGMRAIQLLEDDV